MSLRENLPCPPPSHGHFRTGQFRLGQRGKGVRRLAPLRNAGGDRHMCRPTNSFGRSVGTNQTFGKACRVVDNGRRDLARAERTDGSGRPSGHLTGKFAKRVDVFRQFEVHANQINLERCVQCTEV